MSQGDIFPAGPQDGAIVGGKYRLVHKVSEGSGGSVWEARGPAEKSIALKFLKWSPTRSKEIATEKFKNEFAILKSLSHPHISEIYDFGIDPDSGLYFFTTELLTAGDLRGLIGSSIPVIEEVLVQMLRALEYLRANKLLHLDIKPQNILLRHDGKHPQAALIDFGLATFRPPDRPGGTANYMPPEMIVRRLEMEEFIPDYPLPDHRSDLYSLGVTFYYCLTGVLPFCVTSGPENKVDTLLTLKKHMDHDPPPPSTLRAEVPSYLDRIVMKLLARHPDDRYTSAIIAAQALLYRSPRHKEAESRQTLLAYLPKEGRLIGRRSEWAIIEETLNAVVRGKAHVAPIICIAGGRGMGRTRLLRAIKPFAQQMEMEVSVIAPETESGGTSLEETITKTLSSSSARPHAILIDGIEKLLEAKAKENHARHRPDYDEDEEGGMSQVAMLIRRLRLQQRLQNAPGPRIFLGVTLDTGRCDLKRAMLDLNLDEAICHALVLHNFTNAEVREYLTALLGEPPDASVVEELRHCTNGNPLFITEHLEEMIARGQIFSLAGRPDAKTLKMIGVSFSHAPPPKSLKDSVTEQLAHLPRQACDVALLLACWMRPVSADELRETSGTLATGHELLLLVSSGLVRRNEKDGRFQFVNALTSRIILDGVDPKERARCHDGIARFLKRSRKGKTDDLDVHIAYGGNKAERILALERLASCASKRHEPLEAARHLQVLFDLMPESRPKPRADILVRIGRAYEKARYYDHAKTAYHKLRALRAPRDLHTQFHIMAAERLGLMAMRSRHLSDARHFFAEAAELLKDAPSSIVWKIRLENFIAGADLRDGHIEKAIERFEKTHAVAEKKLCTSERAEITNNELGEAVLRLGDVHRALAILKQELAEASAGSDAERMANRHYLLGDAFRHEKIREFNEALAHYQKGLKLARGHHILELQVRILNGLGNLHLKMSNPDKALSNYREALKLAQQIEGETTSVELMVGMGLAAQQMSKPDSTIEYFEAALDFSSGPKGHAAGVIRRYRPTIYVSLGDAYYQKHDLDRAEEYLKHALELDKKEHLTPDIRYSLYGTYAEIFLERGKIEEARHYIPTLKAIAKVFPLANSHLEALVERVSQH